MILKFEFNTRYYKCSRIQFSIINNKLTNMSYLKMYKDTLNCAVA